MTALGRVAMGVALGVSACANPAADRANPPANAPGVVDSSFLSEPHEYRERPISVEAGEDYFMRTGVGDPYAAGIPYPVFLAMREVFPDLIGTSWPEFNDRFGTLPDPSKAEDDDPVPIGFHLTIDPVTSVPFLMINCQICHTEVLNLPAGPTLVPGLGNKRVRIHAYEDALMKMAGDPRLTVDAMVTASNRAARAQGIPWPFDARRPVVRETIRNLKRRAEARAAATDRYAKGLPGRVATIESFIVAVNERFGTRLDLPAKPGWTKIPDVAVWRYRETNSYDAVTVGAPVAQVAGADFALGVRTKWYDTHRHIATSMMLYLRQFERQLDYPGPVDAERARRGHGLFARHCARCHGSYPAPGETGDVGYHERVVPIAEVGTDATRLDAVTPAFVEAANDVEATRGLTITRKTGGYVPRPLVDVWARGLFGHAGQWPSLAVMAMAPDARPRRFVVDPDGPYDLVGIGSRWRAPKGTGTLTGREYLYDASAAGLGVQGHPFLSDLPAAQRTAILEFLKTL